MGPFRARGGTLGSPATTEGCAATPRHPAILPAEPGPTNSQNKHARILDPERCTVFFSAPYETEGFSLGAPAPGPSHNQPKCPKPPKNPKCQASRNRTRPRSSLFGGSGATTRRRRDPTCLATLNSATKSCLHENLGPRNAFPLFSDPFDLRARGSRVV